MIVRLNQYAPSRSARVLAMELGVLRLRTPSRFRARNGDLIINWGASNAHFGCRVLNEARAVALATDKVAALGYFTTNGVPCPEYTTDQEVAYEWFNDGQVVVARSLTRGSGGRGIQLTHCTDGDTIPPAPLYTKYVKKRDEYRVFVVNGKVIRITQKRSRRGDPADYQVRNSANGWVFCQDGVVAPAAVHRAGRDAVRVLGLDFGAADVGYNAHYEEACVYEVNTAFGLEGTTLTTFADAIRSEYL